MRRVWIYILLGILINGSILSLLLVIKDRLVHDIKFIQPFHFYFVFSAFVFYFILSKIKKLKPDLLNYKKSVGVCMIIYLCSLLIYRLVFVFLQFEHHSRLTINWIFPFILDLLLLALSIIFV
jgi:hypothetical protein